MEIKQTINKLNRPFKLSDIFLKEVFEPGLGEHGIDDSEEGFFIFFLEFCWISLSKVNPKYWASISTTSIEISRPGFSELYAVTENLSTIYGLNEVLKGTASYSYDGTGRVTANFYANAATKNFGLYTHQDLPLQITRCNLYVKNHHTADGQKTLTKRYVNNNFNWEEQISTYLGNVE